MSSFSISRVQRAFWRFAFVLPLLLGSSAVSPAAVHAQGMSADLVDSAN